MSSRKVLAAGAASMMLAATGVGLANQSSAQPAPTGAVTEFQVVAEDGASAAAVKAAVKKAGGKVTAVNAAVGMYTVKARANGFVAAVSKSSAVLGAAGLRAVGQMPDKAAKKGAVTKKDDVTREHGKASGKHGSKSSRLDPLDDKLWGLKMIRADKARKITKGSKKVMVGILDSGIDASNPDLAPNFNKRLSRNFVTDMPVDPNGVPFDGPCEFASCVDPVDWDDSGHGTHVAGTVAAAANGSGVSGVAPGVTLVNIRGGQDAGYLFLGPVVNALTYGANIGLDVINMSFYVDPWLYNCVNNPADSPEAQLEQRATIKAMSRALKYAHRKGVTLVGSLGNNHEDLGKPRTDISSPDFPLNGAYDRVIDNETCVDLPVEGPHVLGISAIGPSERKADYSNYGVEQITVAAPGGWFRDGFGTPTFQTNENLILSSYPKHVLQLEGTVDADGNITPDGEGLVYKDCTRKGKCGYYTYLQGTSMASPHATGVAALIVSKYGKRNRSGLGLDPDKTERILRGTAAERSCPVPPLVSYAQEGRDAEFDALCEGSREFNGFYGSGIIDAYAAVAHRR